MPEGYPNPFDGALARANSSYTAVRADKLIHPLDPDRSPPPLCEFVHDSLRALVLNSRFSCIAASAAVRQGTYRFGVYGRMESPRATAGLARDLFTFVQEQPNMTGDFTTFIASFTEPTPVDERHFEELLWAQLRGLHDQDRQYHDWDPAVSADPRDPRFSFSFAGRAFFVVGLHPASSRWTRRFGWPTLVFNAHYQFEQLREQGTYDRLQEIIRSREQALQGDINPVLADFGDRSEARQYSGRRIEPEWACPFHPCIEEDE